MSHLSWSAKTVGSGDWIWFPKRSRNYRDFTSASGSWVFLCQKANQTSHARRPLGCLIKYKDAATAFLWSCTLYFRWRHFYVNVLGCSLCRRENKHWTIHVNQLEPNSSTQQRYLMGKVKNATAFLKSLAFGIVLIFLWWTYLFMGSLIN